MGVDLSSGSRLVRTVCVVLAIGVLQACGGGGGGGGPTTPAPTAPVIVAPSIDTQPKAATAVDGATATFSVSASGTTLSYQWQKDGQNIVGATAASYTTPPLRYADNGAKYQVVVTGPNATVTSSPVTLAVSPIAVSITTQPAAQTAKDGDVVSFDVAVKGSEPLQYQWLRNGSPIVGATQATYTTAALVLADSGAVFSVNVTNPAGSVASQEAKLQVSAVAPRVITAPESVTTVDGSSVTLRVVAGGSAPLSYQWLRNGSAIAGATGTSFTTTLDYAGSGDRYTVLISNGVGKTTSAEAVVVVNAAAPAISRHPVDNTITTGSNTTFSVVAGGTPPLRYQWYRSTNGGLSWAPISGATMSSYSSNTVTLADAGVKLRVAVSNGVATVNSDVAVLTVQPNIRVLAGTLGGDGYAEGKGNLARFSLNDGGIGATANGDILIADNGNSVFRRVKPDGTTSLLAGRPNQKGWDNGTATAARFTGPIGMVVDASGTIYLADQCTVRKLTPDGQVQAFVGNSTCVHRDGVGEEAGFNVINGIALDSRGNVFVSEQIGTAGAVIRKVTPAGVVTVLAGSSTERGDVNGPGAAARFFRPEAIAVDDAGNVYVGDDVGSIRRVTPTGVVTTYVGTPNHNGLSEGYRTEVVLGAVKGLAFDSAGNLFATDADRLVRITALGMVVSEITTRRDGYVSLSRDGPRDVASFGAAGAVAKLPNGDLAVRDRIAGTVRLYSTTGALSTLAGGGMNYGFVDGVGTSARIYSYGNLPMTPTSTGLLLLDAGIRRIRHLDFSTKEVKTVVGKGCCYTSESDANYLYSPAGVATDRKGNTYFTDSGLHVIRRVGTDGLVTNFAGRPSVRGSVDGIGDAARFERPTHIVMDSNGNLIVADAGNSTFRRVAPDGTVTTLAGQPGLSGYANGKGADARLYLPGYTQMAIDGNDNVYFTDGAGSIRKLTPDGEVSTFAGAPFSVGSADGVAAFARFASPGALAADSRGNVYVCDSDNAVVRKVTPEGYVSTVIGKANGERVLRPGIDGSINRPNGIAVSADGRIYVFTEGAIISD